MVMSLNCLSSCSFQEQIPIGSTPGLRAGRSAYCIWRGYPMGVFWGRSEGWT